MISDTVIQKFLAEYETAAKEHAERLGELAKIEHFKGVLRAQLMTDSGEKSIAAQERSAHASQAWEEFGNALSAAREGEAHAKYRLELIKIRLDLLRTREASRRVEMQNLS